jgi:RNA polymerase sigma-70 factor (ECF subfamily)
MGRSTVEASMALDRTATYGPDLESSLVERARRGDHDAFAALIDSHVEPTYRMALAIMGNEADARDATQDIFLRAWTNLPELREPARFAAWLSRIVVNTCRSNVRGRSRRLIREIPTASFDVERSAFDPVSESHDERTAEVDLVDRALARISPADRTLLALHHWQQLPLEQISRLLGVPTRTVKSRLFSARRALELALEIERQ